MGERLTAERQQNQPGPRMAAPGRTPDRPLELRERAERVSRKKLREAKKHGLGAGPGRGAAGSPQAHRAAAKKAGHASTILAAGAVVWIPGGPRKNGNGRRKPRIALIHRPKYDDWSLPKGKLLPGESPWDAALREVEEETGLVCRLVAPLPAQHYLAQGRPKEVRYWAAVPVSGEFRPNREVDRMKWLKPEQARAKLTHDRDRELIDALQELWDGRHA